MNASDGLRISAWKYPDKTAAVFLDKRYTYKELDRRVNRLANGLLGRGFKKGDHIAYLMYNCMEGIEIIQALLRIGVVLVPIPFRLEPSTMEFIINHCDAKCLFVGSDFVDTIKTLMPKLKNIPKENYIAIGEKCDGMVHYEEVLSPSDENPEIDVKPSEIVYIAYTSGTTGLPKGVVTLSRAMLNNMKNALLRGSDRKGIRPEDRVLLVTMPLVHANSIWSTSITFWYGGVNIVYRSRGFNAEEVLKIIEREKVTTSSVVPYMLMKIMDLPVEIRDKYDVSSITSLGSGSAMLYPSVIEKMLGYFKGVRLSNSYGSSETGPATTLRHHEMGQKPSSIGKPIPGVEVKILDNDGKEMPPHKVGQVWVKSDIAFESYYKEPEKTRAAKRGDWSCAGDLGYYDEEGYFYLADRSDDTIISAGEHIAAPPVENIIVSNPKVAQVAVIGVPDERYGQRVTAVVRLKEGQEATEEEIIQYCRDKELASFKVPRKVYFVTEFPTTLTGKILKRELKERYHNKSAVR